jgi:hypothetical protein
MLTSIAKPLSASIQADAEDEDFDRKGAALLALSENVGKPISESLLGIWMNLLAPYTAMQVEAGVTRIIGSWKYKCLPSFAEVKQSIHNACGLPDPDASGFAGQDLEAEAEAAWLAVFRQISEVGGYGQPKLDEAQAHGVRVCGGWRHLCECTREDLQSWKRTTFVDAYKRARTYGSAMDEGPGAVRRAVDARRQGLGLPCGTKMLGQGEGEEE